MDNLDKETLLRIVKCAVGYNQNRGEVEFDKNFLKLYDETELEFKDCGDSIKLKLKMK